MASLVAKLMIELETRTDDLTMLLEQLQGDLSRYQRLNVLVEIASQVARQTGQLPDEVYCVLATCPQSRIKTTVNSMLSRKEKKRQLPQVA